MERSRVEEAVERVRGVARVRAWHQEIRPAVQERPMGVAEIKCRSAGQQQMGRVLH